MLALMTEVYWGMAIFFSAVFGFQLLAAIFGHFGGAEHVDAAAAHDVTIAGHDFSAAHHLHEGAVQGADTLSSFKLLSIRSITSFGLLFSWAGVLYHRQDPPPSQNLIILYSFLWGMGGMLVTAAIFFFLSRMVETGTRRLVTCLGQRGAVYMDIPAGGAGQIKVVVSNAVSFISARATGGEPLKAGTPIVVKRLLDASTVEVEKTEQ
jgi:hypothetical protein